MTSQSILLQWSLRKANKCVFLLKQLLVTNLLSKAELSSTDKGINSPLERSITMCMKNNGWKSLSFINVPEKWNCTRELSVERLCMKFDCEIGITTNFQISYHLCVWAGETVTVVHGTVSGQHMNETDKNRYNDCFHKKLQMEVSEKGFVLKHWISSDGSAQILYVS